MKLSVVVLAAGKGKRMVSSLPKVMHKIGGVPFLERVVRTAKKLNPENIYVVYGTDVVRDYFANLDVSWVFQAEQLGTGHAVQQALPNIGPDHHVLVLYGDVPLIALETLQGFLQQTPSDALGLITATVENPTGLGRIVRNLEGNVIQIVEQKDANANQLLLKDINTGIIACGAALLKGWLTEIKPHNQQNEYYLTDVISLAVQHAVPVKEYKAEHEYQIRGVNDLWELTELGRNFQKMQARALCLLGVRVIDPARLDLRGFDIQIGQDTVIDPNVILEGPVTIGKECVIGANSIIKNSTLGDGVTVLPNSMLEGSKVADNSSVGPFSRLRPGTVLEAESKVGNFVEVKNTTLGPGSKASHLTYLGDAKIGSNVNIGAGTITCNYDGVNKWETIIKDGAFIGSNSSLVAPVIIGEKATVGAGSTITHHAPDGQLTVTRAKQHNIPHWKRPVK